MVMRVPYFLSGFLPIRKQNVEVRVVQELVDDAAHPLHGDPQGSSACILAVFHSRDVVLGNQERMEIGQRVDVEEGQSVLILVHLVRRRVPRDDLAEDAARVGHVGVLWMCCGLWA